MATPQHPSGPQEPSGPSSVRTLFRALALYLRLGLEQRAHRQRVYETRVALGSAVAAHLRLDGEPAPPMLAKLLAKRREALLQAELPGEGEGDEAAGTARLRGTYQHRQATARLRMADYKLGGWAKGMHYEQPELRAAQQAVEQAESDARFLTERRAEALEQIRNGFFAVAARGQDDRPARPPGVIITHADPDATTDLDGRPIGPVTRPVTGAGSRGDGTGAAPAARDQANRPAPHEHPSQPAGGGQTARGPAAQQAGGDQGPGRTAAWSPWDDSTWGGWPEELGPLPAGTGLGPVPANGEPPAAQDPAVQDRAAQDRAARDAAARDRAAQDRAARDSAAIQRRQDGRGWDGSGQDRAAPYPDFDGEPTQEHPVVPPAATWQVSRPGDDSDDATVGNGLAAASGTGITGGEHQGAAGGSADAGRSAGLGARVRAVTASPAAHGAKRYATRLTALAEPPDERRGGARRFVRPVAAAVALTMVLAGCTAAAASAMVVPPLRAAKENLPDLAALEPLHQAERTQVFDRHGKLIANLNSEQDRVVVPLTEMNWTIQRAVVAAEDERFWEHHGVDERGILRAAVTNLIEDRTAQGGSTITQQYVRNTYPDLKADTLARKVKEAALAAQLETRFTKQQILEGYLNRVYFGSGFYGIEAASQGYFGHSAKQLTLGEAALLAGIIRSPNQINPRVNPEAALARRDTVLDQMVHLDFVKPHMAAEAKQEPLQLDNSSDIDQDSFFIAFLMDLLVGAPPSDTVTVQQSNATGDQRLGATYEERRRQFFEGGLNIYTTYDPAMQRQAEAAIDAHVGDAEDATAALVAIDPRTGAIRAMATARNYSEDQYNPAWQGRRSPGSAFKAFVLAAAIEDGISPDSVWESSGLAEGTEVCGVEWSPENYEGGGSGLMSVRRATALSVNGVYARLMGELCPEKVADMAERLGVSIPDADRHFPAIALGGTSVRVLDMASAYATLAAGGVYRKPWVVDRIVKRSDPEGEPILTGRTPGEQRVSSAVAFETTTILESVLQWGTAAGRGLDGRPSAGKTGTAQNYSNAWFVGYVPQLSTAVWVGNPREERQFTLNGDDTVTGGSAPANIWHDFMAPTLEGDPVEEWIPPDEELDYRIEAPPPPPDDHKDKGDKKGDGEGGPEGEGDQNGHGNGGNGNGGDGNGDDQGNGGGNGPPEGGGPPGQEQPPEGGQPGAPLPGAPEGPQPPAPAEGAGG